MTVAIDEGRHWAHEAPQDNQMSKGSPQYPLHRLSSGGCIACRILWACGQTITACCSSCVLIRRPYCWTLLGHWLHVGTFQRGVNQLCFGWRRSACWPMDGLCTPSQLLHLCGWALTHEVEGLKSNDVHRGSQSHLGGCLIGSKPSMARICGKHLVAEALQDGFQDVALNVKLYHLCPKWDVDLQDGVLPPVAIQVVLEGGILSLPSWCL